MRFVGNKLICSMLCGVINSNHSNHKRKASTLLFIKENGTNTIIKQFGMRDCKRINEIDKAWAQRNVRLYQINTNTISLLQ